METLEAALRTINRMVSDYETKRARSPKSHTEAKRKPVVLKGKTTTEKLVQEPEGAGPSGRCLRSYLSLPLEEYALLDPRWIDRCPGSEANLFVLRVPLHELVMGLDLEPEVHIRVTSEPQNSRVHFLADRFSFGDPALDQDFNLNLKATLTHRPVPEIKARNNQRKPWGGGSSSQWPGSPSSSSSSKPAAYLSNSSSGGSSFSRSPESSSGGMFNGWAKEPGLVRARQGSESVVSEEQLSYGPTSQMVCGVELKLELGVPAPLSVVPGLLLSTAGSLIARLAMQALVPSFVELLLVDYQRWATGAPRNTPAGNLVQNTTTAVATPPHDSPPSAYVAHDVSSPRKNDSAYGSGADGEVVEAEVHELPPPPPSQSSSGTGGNDRNNSVTGDNDDDLLRRDGSLDFEGGYTAGNGNGNASSKIYYGQPRHSQQHHGDMRGERSRGNVHEHRREHSRVHYSRSSGSSKI